MWLRTPRQNVASEWWIAGTQGRGTMHLASQFLVIDSKGERHIVSAWRMMTERLTAGGVEFVPAITHYKVDDSHSVERIDDTTFRTPSGEILRQVAESAVEDPH
jgi:hypothetical protein